MCWIPKLAGDLDFETGFIYFFAGITIFEECCSH